MQKKIIAMAVAGLISGVAIAQSNVTIYGTIDMAYVHQSKAVVAGDNAYNAIDDGGWDRSRFVLKGTEVLGNGLSVSFQQEFAVHTDVNGGPITQRPGFVALAGKGWGSIKAGNFWSVVDDTVSNSSAGSGGQVGWGEGVIDIVPVTLANNAVQFDSLDYSGFKFAVGYSSHYQWDGLNDNASSNNNMRAWFGGVNYTNGDLFVGATYLHGSQGLNNIDDDEWLLGASYDFKVAKVGLAYSDISIDGDTNFGVVGSDKLDRKTWRANVSVPITDRDTVTLSYTDSKLERNHNLSDYDASAWGVAYMHALSKRTTLYAAGYVADAKQGFLLLNSDGSASYDGYENGAKFGIRHQF